MSSPKTDDVMFAYIVVAPHAVSLVLILVILAVMVDNNQSITWQQPVYYVSKFLQEAEIRYLPLEKAILAVVHGTQKLLHYFPAHMVVILTQLPLKAILRSADYTGRIAKWGMILWAFDIKYMPHTSIKDQVLADLVVEFVEGPAENESEEHHMGEKSVGLVTA